PYGAGLAAEVEAVTVAVEAAADYRARGVEFDVAGTRFTCHTPDGPRPPRSPLVGLFNVQNVLCALAAARALGVSAADVQAALPAFGGVPGRFETVDERQEVGGRGEHAHPPGS